MKRNCLLQVLSYARVINNPTRNCYKNIKSSPGPVKFLSFRAAGAPAGENGQERQLTPPLLPRIGR